MFRSDYKTCRAEGNFASLSRAIKGEGHRCTSTSRRWASSLPSSPSPRLLLSLMNAKWARMIARGVEEEPRADRGSCLLACLLGIGSRGDAGNEETPLPGIHRLWGCRMIMVRK
uniref:Uncharacterized protein n=1 Tax=Vespula pensylvanica TaxID=30213 RepID=A0A834PAH5_VESPE|nr:hypothetical protein H0235_002668 [Vespula pensylvanica]